MPSKIEDYALIGDCHTAALVGRDGSIDWLCWPRFDSSACFAALLGTADNGRWQIAPAAEPVSVRRAYRKDTLVLETEFETPEGTVVLIDFMPLRDNTADLVRLVQGKRGAVPMRMHMTLRFDYGLSIPWVRKLQDGSGIQAVSGPDKVALRTPVSLSGVGLSTVAEFTVHEGETVPFIMTHVESHHSVPRSIDPQAALRQTTRYWQAWASRCVVGGPWADAVRRSLITLKALTYSPTGGLVAAPTTSLPEQLGGVRNWDYRYCWLRDATLTLLALMNAGYFSEAAEWRQWLERAAAGSPEQMQIMYGLAGERRLAEWEVDWLAGYEGSRPVRIGNNAVGQLQLDVYGEVLDAMYQARVGGLSQDDTSWALQCALVSHLEKIWRLPDEGIWEVRNGRQHFTYSKVMAWVAFDRAIKTAETFGLDGPLEHWRAVRDEIHDDVCRHGFDAKRGSFVQSYGSHELDASLLMIPEVGFLPPSDPRVQGTLQAIREDLMTDGLVQRYRSHHAADGLPAGEGVFLACSFWMVDNLVMQGRRDEAQQLFEHLLSLRNDVGLLAEEYDTVHRRQVGNFPQAFSHIALVHAALRLSGDRGESVMQREDEPAQVSSIHEA